MKRKKNHPAHQQREENLLFLDQRVELLDTMREMITIELDRRALAAAHAARPAHPSPPAPSFWRRLLRLFSI